MKRSNSIAASAYMVPGAIVIIGSTLCAGLASWKFSNSLIIGLGAALGGIAWGLLLVYLARRIARNDARRHTWANRSLFLACLTAGLLLGGGLVYQLLMTAAASHAETLPVILQSSIGGILNFYFIILNTLMEYFFIPAVLLLNWHEPRRRMVLIMSVVIFYLSRSWTYLYFAPYIIEVTQGIHPGQMLDVATLANFRQWVGLDWWRNIMDAIVCLGLLAAGILFNSKKE